MKQQFSAAQLIDEGDSIVKRIDRKGGKSCDTERKALGSIASKLESEDPEMAEYFEFMKDPQGYQPANT